MSQRALIFICFLTFFRLETFSQDYFSYGGGNFSGLNQVIANPASAADNRLKLDIILAGADASFNNSWFKVKRDALRFSDGKFPATWSNSTPNVADNVFKNFKAIDSKGSKELIAEARVILPSVLYQIDPKNAIAFTWCIRQVANVSGISPQVANLFEKELDLSVTQNNMIHNKNLNAVQMSWAEYGFTYAGVVKDDGEHFFKAGVTPKILQGLEAAFVLIRELDFFLSTKDTTSYFNANFSYGRSGNMEAPLKNGAKDFYRFTAKPALGIDFGLVYEWRPDFEKHQIKNGRGETAWKNDINKYKLRLAASVVDLGRLKFEKEGRYYDLNLSVRKDNVNKFFTVSDYEMLDSLLVTDFSNKNVRSDFTVLTPAALNTRADYSLNKLVYLTLAGHLPLFYGKHPLRVHNYASVCLAPRIEHYWFEIALPFTWSAISARRGEYVSAGLDLRLGPLCIGTNNLLPFFSADVAAINFYTLLKISIPYKDKRDRDKDGIIDARDECPEDPGDAALNGCPDTDKDQVPDYLDGCPHQPGLVKFRGCPDTDTDDIPDAEDKCPAEKGSIAMKGCPDADNDGITDHLDSCPDKPGESKFSGCPDTDQDSLHDGIDRCANLAGPRENNGCPWPDTDKDGIIDRLDSCAGTPGVAAHKGCPEPPKLAPAEKKVLEMAFARLEFESGKDIIKKVSYPSLSALAKVLITHKTDWRIRLSGHTDNEGTEASNFTLSEKRAKQVKKFLAQKAVPEDNIIVEWFGQTKPIADNSSKEGKQKNRRVEMVILFKD